MDNEEELINNISSEQFGTCIDVLRCGAHTVNLALKDAMKQSSCEPKLTQIRSHVKKSKHVIFRPIFKMHGIPVPVLDCETRWGSAIDMVESFLKIEPIENELKKVEPSYTVDDSLWSFCKTFAQAFQPIKKLLKNLQREDLTIGDLYRYYWIDTRIELKKMQENNLAVALLQNLGERKNRLFQNKIFLAGLFVDPRFNFKDSPYMSTQQKQIAVVSIKCIYLEPYCPDLHNSSMSIFVVSDFLFWKKLDNYCLLFLKN